MPGCSIPRLFYSAYSGSFLPGSAWVSATLTPGASAGEHPLRSTLMRAKRSGGGSTPPTRRFDRRRSRRSSGAGLRLRPTLHLIIGHHSSGRSAKNELSKLTLISAPTGFLLLFYAARSRQLNAKPLLFQQAATFRDANDIYIVPPSDNLLYFMFEFQPTNP